MSEEEATTIQLKKSIVKELKSIRRYPRETYNETISNLIEMAKESKNRRQYPRRQVVVGHQGIQDPFAGF